MPMERHEQTNSIKKMDYRNMKGIFLAAALAAVFTTGCRAQQPASTAKAQIWDTRNHPEDYYLQDGQQPSSVALLPAPPEPGSLLFLYDEARYKWGKQQRNTPRALRPWRTHGSTARISRGHSARLSAVPSAGRLLPNFIGSCRICARTPAIWVRGRLSVIICECGHTCFMAIRRACARRKSRIVIVAAILPAIQLWAGRRHWCWPRSMSTGRMRS